jgi:hypothetical protein
VTRRGLFASLGLVVLIVGAAALGSTRDRTVTLLDLVVGDCMVLPTQGWDGRVSGIEVLTCEEALSLAGEDRSGLIAARVETVGSLTIDSDPTWPGEDESLALASRWCLEAANAAGDLVAVAPDASTWAIEPRVVCLRLGR